MLKNLFITEIFFTFLKTMFFGKNVKFQCLHFCKLSFKQNKLYNLK
jgi:hypothetical protein